MEHDIAFTVDHHEVCDETGYCKRCGIHITHATEMNYMCTFATNTVAITHIRATTIADEKLKAAHKKTMEYVEKVRQQLDERELELLEALEGYPDEPTIGDLE